jgi:hypothetical protein
MSNTYELSTREYVILSAAMGGDVHLGFEDPFKGYLVEEINEVVEKEVIPGLQEKSLLMDQEGETYQVDPSLESLLWNAVFPDLSLIVNQYSSGSMGDDREILHFSSAGVVQQQGVNDDIHLKTMSVDEWKNWISERIDGVSKSFPGGQRLALPEKVFRKAEQSAVQDEKETGKMITEVGVNQESAEALAQTLGTFRRRMAFVVVHRSPKNWEVNGFAFLEGGNGYWLLRPIQRDRGEWVEMEPCSGEEVRKRLNVWLKGQGLPVMANEDQI